VNITNNSFFRNKNSNKYISTYSLAIGNIAVNHWHKATLTHANKISNRNLHLLSNNNLDIGDDIANVKDGTANLLFWGLITPSTSDLHQSLTWCNPRFQGRGDDSVYNRPFKGLKTIVAVLCGLINSLITRVSINNSIFSTYLGNQNSWSLAIVNCFRPFCFAYKGS
tara:strand:- start:20 stop:520 length:501 start_codon:yes stop_codon:yes gene_type:complete